MTEKRTAEKRGHFLDLKIPLGGLLSFYGIVLVLFGIFAKKDIYGRSLGININLIWGILILAVGLGLLLAVLAKKGPRVPDKP